MIWLASYPRSGNTYSRILLKEIYGLKSSEFHDIPGKKVKKNYQSYPIVKTHLFPGKLIPNDPLIPAIYIIRDGRDAVVSLAHHTMDNNKKRGLNFYDTLKEVILSAEGSYFGGWGQHVQKWTERADLIIRFEDLILEPIKTIEKIKPFITLPNPTLAPPNFQDLRSKKYTYGRRRKKNRESFFRRGIIGSWKDEMPLDLQKLFIEIHGNMLIQNKYIDGIFDLITSNLNEK